MSAPTIDRDTDTAPIYVSFASAVQCFVDGAVRDMDSGLRQWRSGSTSPTPTTASPEVNVELLGQVMEYITEHPEEHDQKVWAQRTRTGVVGCVAYHTTRLSGRELHWPSQCNGEARFVQDGENVTPIFVAARDALGLTSQQADVLFDAANDLTGLWSIAGTLSNGHLLSGKVKV